MGIAVEDFTDFTYQQRQWLTGATARSEKLAERVGFVLSPVLKTRKLLILRVKEVKEAT
jgi:hypothetical protein